LTSCAARFRVNDTACLRGFQGLGSTNFQPELMDIPFMVYLISMNVAKSSLFGSGNYQYYVSYVVGNTYPVTRAAQMKTSIIASYRK
jgi:hypothetical protein